MTTPPVVDGGLTAVIPTCRRPALLETALASVAAQDRKPDRLIVVDVDGASWSRSAAEAYAAQTGIATSYRVCPGPSSPGRTRNLGAAGTDDGWLAFLDDDDSWDPSYLTCAVGSGTDFDLVATRVRLRRGPRVEPLPPLPETLHASSFLSRNPGVTGSSIVVRAAAFHRIGGFDETLAAYNDMDFMVRALDAGLRVRVVQAALVEQAIHDSGQATSASRVRLDALDDFTGRYERRMSRTDRRIMRRERHRIQKRTADGRVDRLRHLAADVALTPPAELLDRIRRRRRLGGSYE